MLSTENRKRDPLRECKNLRRNGQLNEALATLRAALRNRELPATKLDAAGRFLRTAFSDLALDTLNVRVFGQCTTSFLTSPLVAQAWAHGVALDVSDGGFDSIIQDVATLNSDVDVVVLLPWNQRLLADDQRSGEEKIQDEQQLWLQAWQQIPASSRLIQIGYDWIHAGAMGTHLGGRSDGDVRLVREMNSALRAALPEHAYFIDLEQVSADVGRRNFYDARNDVWTRQPFSQQGVAELTRHLFAAIRATTTGPKKCLVLDLDNTLWGGVVGETGPHGIELGDSPDGEAFRRFQRLARQLKQRGVVLAVCSKNNAEDAREPFGTNRDMVLKIDDFATFEATWDPKPVAIERIAKTLKLGLDSFVFFDDNPAEREAVRQQLPMVEVVDVPTDPAGYVTALLDGLWFESPCLTDADRQRAEQYCAEQQRRAAQQSSISLDDYLDSLQMVANVANVDEGDMQRVGQLLAKTNQFNLATRRHTVDDVRRMLDSERALALTLRLTDRLGDYGLVSVVLAVPDVSNERPTLRLDTWLMSCRAIGRSVEQFLMNEVVKRAATLGYTSIIGEYVPTKKNAQVETFYPSCGFQLLDETSAGHQRFQLDVESFSECPTSVSAATNDGE